MPLNPFQSQLVKLLIQNRSEGSYLAGGAALNFEPQSIRFSNDLDYFHDSEELVASSFNADQALLLKNNYQIKVEMHQPGYIRALVSFKNQNTKIEWAQDSAWRFMPAQFKEDRGFVLHPADLATNKLLALAGRDEARDYLDIHDVHLRILPLGALVWAACGKDPGFNPNSLLELLRRRGKYQAQDFQRLLLNTKIDLPALKQSWLQMLDEAEHLVTNLPAQEVGCLYYCSKEKKFVCPPLVDRPTSINPHFGKLGGVLPQIIDVR